MTSDRVLNSIMRRDPDGWPEMPSPGDYVRFEAWIVNTYGRSALADYRGWGSSEDTQYRPFEEDEGYNGA